MPRLRNSQARRRKFNWRAYLKPNVRSKCCAQIVVSALIKIDLITDIKAQSDRAETAFYAATRIKGAHDVVVPKILHITKEGSDGGRRDAEMSVQDAPFENHKWVEIRMSERHFGTEQPMQHSQIRAVHGYRAAVIKSFGENLIEVVAHLRFQHHVASQPQARSNTDAGG